MFSLKTISGAFLSKNTSSLTRNVHGNSRIGTREVVGHGHNGSCNYKDDAHFPFPAIRFQENTSQIQALREKEKGDWKFLSLEDKKALYRASFCQTFAEFQHPTGQWKFILGWGLFFTSFGFWAMMFKHFYVDEPLPDSLKEENQKAQLKRILDLKINNVDGLSSRWDYNKGRWKGTFES
ncbi:cytochrome c oxidase subunit 4 isoform 1, mitochondrial-like [Pectinophora gossypiella]|uniref:cytochrome c oxidase subunit 4 isoform 1, mitochondrial-like n=1 Tax=Pectinophora gossypiella TaxID=13191 RepID=UPI00214E1E7A|nr:cytochrome c oxidase subunit 4 isoform 1, mitochondrial-like [Pectinophora gossypiella]